MFDTVCVRGGSSTTTQSQSLNINAVSGTIIKSHPKSFIDRFGITSEYARQVFCDNPRIPKHKWKQRYDDETWSNVETEQKEIVVLQTMLCGDGMVLAEIMWKEDFDELFEYREVEDN